MRFLKPIRRFFIYLRIERATAKQSKLRAKADSLLEELEKIQILWVVDGRDYSKGVEKSLDIYKQSIKIFKAINSIEAQKKKLYFKLM